jgi:hypothetical protein
MALQHRAGIDTSSGVDCVQTSFSWVGLHLLLLRAARPKRLSMCASATDGDFSSSPAPYVGVRPAFSLKIDRRPWNLSLQGYLPPPGALPATPPRLLPHRAAATSLFLRTGGCTRCLPPAVVMALHHRSVIARAAFFLLLLVSLVSVDLSEKCFWMYSRWQSPLSWPTPPHFQQTGRFVLLYSILGGGGTREWSSPILTNHCVPAASFHKSTFMHCDQAL